MKKLSKQMTSRRNKMTVSSTSFQTVSTQSSEQEEKTHHRNFVELFPLEVNLKIFSELDIQSLCNAAMTCRSWNRIIENSDHLWKHHCLTVRTVCQREIDGDRGNGYSWKVLIQLHSTFRMEELISKVIHHFISILSNPKVTLLRNYWKSVVKHEWLSGKYSNIHSCHGLPEISMYPMDADTWGEILEAALKR